MTGVNEIITGIQEVCFKSFGAMAWLTGYGLMYDRLRIDWDFCTYPAFPTQNISVGATGSVDAQTAFEQLETKANQKWETILS